MAKWIIAAIVVLALGLFLVIGRSMLLVPDEPIRIVRSIDVLNSADADATVAVLPAGEPVRVTACRNLTDDQVYRVRTPAGVEGFVADGRFTLQREPFLQSLTSFERVVCW